MFGNGYLGRAIDHGAWIFAGLLFLPLTTLTFAYAVNSMAPSGDMSNFGWPLVGVAALVDLGMLGGGRRATRKESD